MTRRKVRETDGELFDPLDEEKRRQLRARGWHEAGGRINGRWCWRMPDMGGAIVDELEAFKHLERLQNEEALRVAREVDSIIADALQREAEEGTLQ